MLVEWVKIVILGVVEGITEFLPISSTGHLIVASSLLQFDSGLGTTFEIFIQIGAVVAVFGIFQEELRRQVRVARVDPAVRSLWRNILIAFVPAVALAFFFHSWIKATLFHPWVVGLALIVGGIAMIQVERYWVARRRVTAATVRAMTARQALLVGLLQMLAVIPGISRSAASIIGGMVGGLSRGAATEFSFLLAIPTLGAATVGDLLKNLDKIQPDHIPPLVVGAVVSGVVAWAAVRWLLRYVARNDFVAFGYYRILAGAVILILIVAGWLPPTY